MDANGNDAVSKRAFSNLPQHTGKGVRDTLSILRRYIPSMTIYEVPSGTRIYDWEVL